MKKVFVIGDSISLYYHKFLKERLNGKAIYSRKGNENEIRIALQDPNNPFGANGGDSNLVIEYMKQLKNENNKFDILLVNCGLHDLRTDRETSIKQVDEEKYRANLFQIVELGKELSENFIWICTTHVDDDRHNKRKDGSFRYNDDVINYNKIAEEIMNCNEVPIIDLYTFTKKLENPNMYRDHVHFKDEISEKQAQFIYENIKNLL